MHQLLTDPVYGGRWRFNYVDYRSRRRKADAEQIFSDVPAIIEPAQFASVQDLLKARNPRIAPPRSVTGPVLLTGLAFCSLCDRAMTLRTGTSKSGAVHRYYACSTCARKGKTACAGRTIPMARLDTLVTESLIGQLLCADRTRALLSTLARQRAERAASVDARLAALEREAGNAGEKLRRLYKLVEDGVAELDDVLKQRIRALKADHAGAREALASAQSNVRAKADVTEENVARFGGLVREALTQGGTPARELWLTSIVGRIEVNDGVIHLSGRDDPSGRDRS